MKVISGSLKGRNILGYSIQGTRPTMDRVKESVFAMIQDHIQNSICLDLFAGSGSLGIEAISNGSKYTYFVDNNKECYLTILKNLNNYKVNNYKVLQMDYMTSLKYFNDNKTRYKGVADAFLSACNSDRAVHAAAALRVVQYLLKLGPLREFFKCKNSCGIRGCRLDRR